MRLPSEGTLISTHCPYCVFQCGMRLAGPAENPAVAGDEAFPVNKGALRIKGWASVETLAHPKRLRSPLVCNAARVLAPASWDEALSRTATEFKKAQSLHGKDSVGVFGDGSLTNEKAYLLGKFARVALGTSNIDYNGRFCMSSAATSIKALGAAGTAPNPDSSPLPGGGLHLLIPA